MTIASLSSVMPPPANPIEARGSWSDVEGVLGAQLPDDYRDFIERYGSGTIDHFITILNPFSVRPTLNLLEQSKRQLNALRDLRENFHEQNPFELYPSHGGLLPVAITDNGDVIHWLTCPNRDSWAIVVNEARSPDYQKFECSLTDFLTGIIKKSIVCRAFPAYIFRGHAEFEPI